mgnify:FL=1
MSPASMPKRGASHDLAIAAGVLSAAGAIPHDSLGETIVLGEVNLDGTVLRSMVCCRSCCMPRSGGYGD